MCCYFVLPAVCDMFLALSCVFGPSIVGYGVVKAVS